MGVTWQTRAEIKEAHSPIPSPKSESTRSFAVPETMEADFERLLEHDHPNIFTFQLIRDWYDQDEKKFIRASQTPIDWKSKIGNSDMNTNFKVGKSTEIRKGDMVIREDGTIFLLNWSVQNHPNNWATQSAECNANAEFTRRIPDRTDKRGM